MDKASALPKIIDYIRWKFKRHKNVYYGQHGEDVILQNYFNYRKRKNGFYVDIGAYHPVALSNTYWFYKRGWRGINIEPNPSLLKEFKKCRKKDINLNMGVSKKSQILMYYTFKRSSGFNTFVEGNARKIEQEKGIKSVQMKIQTEPLDKILQNYLPTNQIIDFMSVDTEGFELEILKSNNWNTYRPEILVIETLNENIEQIIKSLLYQFICDQSYVLYSWAKPSLIFSRKN